MSKQEDRPASAAAKKPKVYVRIDPDKVTDEELQAICDVLNGKPSASSKG